MKERDTIRVDVKVRSIDKDGLRLTTSHSTQTFYQADCTKKLTVLGALSLAPLTRAKTEMQTPDHSLERHQIMCHPYDSEGASVRYLGT